MDGSITAPIDGGSASRKTAPYLFLGQTTSLCEACLALVPAKIIAEGERVYYLKRCREHGVQKTLIADDLGYWKAQKDWLKPGDRPLAVQTRTDHGCPYDCGLCPDHMQHSCLSIVEISDHCNLRCPTCYAASGPERLTHRTMEEVVAMLDAIVASEGEADVVQISGGEPTLHPQFFDILDAAKARPIKHLMVNTNGLRLAQDAAFAERLAGYAPGLEVYLQFDSLKREALMDLRGADLRGPHEAALARLDALGLSTTLVMTVKRGVNDDEVGDVIRHAQQHPCVRGVTLQPIQNAGRVEAYDAARHRLTVSELRRRIAEQSGIFTPADVLPVPCNPDTLAMAYAIRNPDSPGGLVPLTRYLDAATLLSGDRSTIVFEGDPALKASVFKLFSTNHSPESQSNCLSELLCCLPRIDAPQLNYRDVFRVLIVQFMDAQSLDIRALKKSCIHIARPDGRLIPFEAYNLFYRDERQAELEVIREEINAQRERRLQFRPRAAAPLVRA